jgi:hypothetical protein
MNFTGFCDIFIITKSIPNKNKRKILSNKINIIKPDKEWRYNVG